VNAAAAAIAARVRRHGPRPFDEVVDVALYDVDHGFYSGGGAAGRHRGDFITSPEVGPLFGAVMAHALDEWWHQLGDPDPFIVVECGAGAGTLAQSIHIAQPACLAAATYVLVERSAALRRRHADHLPLSAPALALGPRGADLDEDTFVVERGTGPRFVSLGTMPALSIVGVVLANELLDNLAFGLAERGEHGWSEVRVGLSPDDTALVEELVPAPDAVGRLLDAAAPEAAVGARAPVQTAAATWLRDALGHVERGRVVVIDYVSTTADLAARPPTTWLRTYRAHERGTAPLDDLGGQDLTVEVCADQLAHIRPPALDRSQTEFLIAHGLDALVEEGRRTWAARAHIGDLEAVRGRSRVNEAAALTDPTGLGAFRVLEWPVD
jgi:SAM-dependent MidA family methyltransferase